MAHLRALGWLLPKLLLVQESAFTIKKLPNLRKMPFHKFLDSEWLFSLL
jgi:hypothetical protein